MPTIQRAFKSFAKGLADELKSNKITLKQAQTRLEGFGYKITDKGCFYRTFTMCGSSSRFFIHLWGSLQSDKTWTLKFEGIAWGDKYTEYDRVEV